MHPPPRPRRALRPGGDTRTATSPTTWGAPTASPAARTATCTSATRQLGCVGMVSMLPDMAPVACGMALAFKIRGEQRVAMTFFGEGSTANGQWHEAMNLAGVQRLPVVFMLENNQFAYSTPNELEFAVDPVERAHTYGFPGVTVDGNDVEAVFAAAHEAVERARAGRGPDADRVPDDAHARPRRARRHELRAAGDVRGVVAARPDRPLLEAARSRARVQRGRDRSDPGRGARPTSPNAPRRRSPRRCRTRRSPSEGVFADDLARSSATARRPGRAGSRATAIRATASSNGAAS